ncbi:hypothetical protein [Legionella jordanis]|uniref:Outer membrane protein assembly factor BamC n=1 Tax=Legionella jordanis TaxID=456 RepID=A0A0W0VE45_9GAMM|nr:hypothetical protein [Legionella jordanis]KTD18398.1 hypothetical protein Ljor_2704 [Legionella jordanis]RMX05577.1 hypothetical protein EAW55_01185 [Legionella jordanis]RMX20956.1 hypothetical protein EAS68_05860 [Legionella jordanis]VEH13256.1 Uncharacterised protein [Legionella jordanis]HAT8713607.1 hypothetical protein [Legionella jordanis]
MKKIGFLMISMWLLTACSNYASNGESLYLKSRNGAAVAVPPPLTDSNISHFYDLPQSNQNARVSIAPPADPTITEPAT